MQTFLKSILILHENREKSKLFKQIYRLKLAFSHTSCIYFTELHLTFHLTDLTKRYIKAAPEAISRPLYERFAAGVGRALGREVATGEFGADMQVELVNDGPVTIWIDSRQRE